MAKWHAFRRQYMMASSGAFLCSHSGRLPASRSFRAWVYLRHSAAQCAELSPLHAVKVSFNNVVGSGQLNCGEQTVKVNYSDASR